MGGIMASLPERLEMALGAMAPGGPRNLRAYLEQPGPDFERADSREIDQIIDLFSITGPEYWTDAIEKHYGTLRHSGRQSWVARLRSGRSGESLLYFTDDFLPDVVFNDFRVAHAPKHPCILGFGLFCEKLTELSA
jgi:hypothetical protein